MTAESNERSLMHVAEGDTVLVYSSYAAETVRRRKDSDAEYAPEPCPVVKVGRTLLHVNVGRTYERIEKFARDDGVESRPSTAIGMPDVAYTPEGWDMRERRDRASRSIARLARKHSFYGVPLERLEAIAAEIDKTEELQ